MKVIIVDDNAENRYLLEALLKGNGHDVVVLTNGAEAMEELKSGECELIISDILMPVMDGFQLCREVKADKTLAHIPFIIYTATYTGPRDEEFAMKIGADHFLQKPCEPEVFMKAIDEVMAAARRRGSPLNPEPAAKEEEILKLYNERLVRKLEQKMLELEREIRVRRETEETLRAREQKYRMLTDNTLDVIWAMNLNLVFTYVNPAIERLLGYSPEEWVGSVLSDHCDEENFARISRIVADEMAKGPKGSGVILETVLLNKKREPVPFEIHGRVTHDEKGEPVALQGISRDITIRKRQEENLHQVNALLDSIVENIPDMIFLKDAEELRFIRFNRAGENLLGYAREDLIGKNDYDLVPKELADSLMKNDREILRGKAIVDIPSESLLNRNKEERILHTKKVPILDENGKPEYLLGISEDITEMKLAEKNRHKLAAQLLQAQKLESIGTLASGIAHDFNNILTSIIGFTEIVLDGVEKDSIAESNLQEVYKAGLRAKDLVRQILAFARQSDEQRKPIYAKPIVKEVLSFLRSSIPSTIEIKQHITSDASIMGDPTQLHQVIMNLCTNAAHAMEEKGGILEIGLEDIRIDSYDKPPGLGLRSGDYLKLSISDTGSGIPPDVIGSIFEPYYTTKEPGEGTGMGLALVHGIVESYGGRIEVKTEVGKGSVFSIYLPVTGKDEHQHLYEPEALPTGEERILFVDDEAPIAKMGGQILEKLGYAVSIRVSSVEALELFRSKPNDFDLVITDMTMPNMTGDQLVAELMAIRPDIPVILCTGYSKKISDKSAAEIGIKAFAYKPIVKADLAKTIRKVLDEAKAGTDDGQR